MTAHKYLLKLRLEFSYFKRRLIEVNPMKHVSAPHLSLELSGDLLRPDQMCPLLTIKSLVNPSRIGSGWTLPGRLHAIKVSSEPLPKMTS